MKEKIARGDEALIMQALGEASLAAWRPRPRHHVFQARRVAAIGRRLLRRLATTRGAEVRGLRGSKKRRHRRS